MWNETFGPASSEFRFEDLEAALEKMTRKPICTSITVAPQCEESMRRYCNSLTRKNGTHGDPAPTTKTMSYFRGFPVLVNPYLQWHTAIATMSDGTVKTLDLRPGYLKELT